MLLFDGNQHQLHKKNEQRRFKRLISNSFEVKSYLRPKWLILTKRFERGYFCKAGLLMSRTIIKS